MFAHVSVGVTDFHRSLALYRALMKELGYETLFGNEEEEFMAFGPEDSFFIINTPAEPERGTASGCNGAHICIKAKSPEAVDAFYQKAIELGASDGGKPGIRAEYAPNYYAAFIFDYDGNKIEVLATS